MKSLLIDGMKNGNFYLVFDWKDGRRNLDRAGSSSGIPQKMPESQRLLLIQSVELSFSPVSLLNLADFPYSNIELSLTLNNTQPKHWQYVEPEFLHF